jgi:hypothetical protein
MRRNMASATRDQVLYPTTDKTGKKPIRHHTKKRRKRRIDGDSRPA